MNFGFKLLTIQLQNLSYCAMMRSTGSQKEYHWLAHYQKQNKQNPAFSKGMGKGLGYSWFIPFYFWKEEQGWGPCCLQLGITLCLSWKDWSSMAGSFYCTWKGGWVSISFNTNWSFSKEAQLFQCVFALSQKLKEAFLAVFKTTFPSAVRMVFLKLRSYFVTVPPFTFSISDRSPSRSCLNSGASARMLSKDHQVHTDAARSPSLPWLDAAAPGSKAWAGFWPCSCPPLPIGEEATSAQRALQPWLKVLFKHLFVYLVWNTFTY